MSWLPRTELGLVVVKAARAGGVTVSALRTCSVADGCGYVTFSEYIWASNTECTVR
jgi:hypothetical protein